jgi:hypothetical protein
MMWRASIVLVALCSAAYAKDPPDVIAIKTLIASEATALEEGGDPANPKVFTKTATASMPESEVENNERGGLRGMVAGAYLIEVKPSAIRIGLARDGKSAWVTFQAATTTACNSCESEPGPEVRSSQLVVKVGNAWLVETALWSVGVADAKVNKAAKAGKQDAPEKLADADTGNASLRAALTALVTKGFDPALASNKELIGIGSAPKELVGFKNLVPYFNKAWAGKLAITGPVWATVAPSGTTGAVMANVELTKTEGKTTYKVPFRWFVVFDKNAAGAWAPVHVHFAVR